MLLVRAVKVRAIGGGTCAATPRHYEEPCAPLPRAKSLAYTTTCATKSAAHHGS
jgi:hypothetical protein